MIVFNRKAPIKHNLKKRFFKFNKKPELKFGTLGFYCLYTFRFEYRYCLFFRKFYKKMFRKRKRKIRTQQRRRMWLFIRPNYSLSHKSKNARMGKGKGNFKRWCTIVYPGRIFIEHNNISISSYKKYLSKMKNKLKLNLLIFYRFKQIIKTPTITTSLTCKNNKLIIVRVRNQLDFRK